MNALGQSHHRETLVGPTKAAIAYSQRKIMHDRTQARCLDAGIVFEPVVMECQGGLEPRAAALLHRIAEAVATNEGLDAATCKRQLFDNVARIIARRTSAMVRRRAAKRPEDSTSRRLKRFLADTRLETTKSTAAAFIVPKIIHRVGYSSRLSVCRRTSGQKRFSSRLPRCCYDSLGETLGSASFAFPLLKES